MVADRDPRQHRGMHPALVTAVLVEERERRAGPALVRLLG
jgi:hypothetical protein